MGPIVSSLIPSASKFKQFFVKNETDVLHLPSRAFPSCRFGDKCMYTHPLCKFNELCSRPDCPYAHNVPKVPIVPFIVPMHHMMPSRPLVQNPAAAGVVCKYFPKCKNSFCEYFHPKVSFCKIVFTFVQCFIPRCATTELHARL